MTETTAEMANPKIRECADQLARELHATAERKRTSVSLERYDWEEMPASEQTLMISAVYSLLYRGIIICPIPEHRISIDLQSPAPSARLPGFVPAAALRSELDLLASQHQALCGAKHGQQEALEHLGRAAAFDQVKEILNSLEATR